MYKSREGLVQFITESHFLLGTVTFFLLRNGATTVTMKVYAEIQTLFVSQTSTNNESLIRHVRKY